MSHDDKNDRPIDWDAEVEAIRSANERDMESATPRTDAAHGKGRFANCVDVDFARQLERELKAALSATGAITPSPNTLWVVWYEDPSKKHEVFFGEVAEAGARQRYKQAFDNWACHLLVRVPTGQASAFSDGGADNG